MDQKPGFLKKLLRLCSYILVAALASAATWMIAPGQSKLDQMQSLIADRFVGQADETAVEDAAAAAMVMALGDRWSYYIPADEYAAHLDSENNEYVGIGITIINAENLDGIQIVDVDPEGPAAQAGIQAGDMITHVDGQPVTGMNTSQLRGLIIGEVNTQVSITLQRSEQTLEFQVTRKKIHNKVATGEMLTDTTGYVSIANFHTGAAKETIAVIEDLRDRGAESLILDVRDNPGGFTDELIKLLDYLLPEGLIFRTESYSGKEKLDESDAACLDIPMAVLINGNSYSAAEFFAAALSEYGWAVTVGEKTVGKGYYQQTLRLNDGSALNLSTGKYFTPHGVNLAEAGGLTPDIPVAPAQGIVEPAADPQIAAALEAVSGKT